MRSWEDHSSSNGGGQELSASKLREQTGTTIGASTDMDWEDLNDVRTIGTAKALDMTGLVETVQLEAHPESSNRSLYSSEEEDNESSLSDQNGRFANKFSKFSTS